MSEEQEKISISIDLNQGKHNDRLALIIIGLGMDVMSALIAFVVIPTLYTVDWLTAMIAFIMWLVVTIIVAIIFVIRMGILAVLPVSMTILDVIFGFLIPSLPLIAIVIIAIFVIFPWWFVSAIIYDFASPPIPEKILDLECILNGENATCEGKITK